MISGFESDIAILLLFVSIIASYLVAWWTYGAADQLPKTARYGNIFLRGTAILILLLLLFNPAVERTESELQRNNIAVLMDNSLSVTINKGDWDGEESYREVISQLPVDDRDEVNYHVYGFDSRLFPTTLDSLPLNGTTTDIHRSVSGLFQRDTVHDAAILVTDGIVNRGRDPLSMIVSGGIPFYTVAIGDTTQLRDVLVRNVFHNETAYTNSRMPVTVEVLNDGLPDEDIRVNLYRDGNLEDQKSFRTTESRSVHTLEFEVAFVDPGTKRFRVEIPEVDGEWTTANNTRSFVVEVNDDQINILHIAFEVHPDVSTVRNMLASDESVNLNRLTWLREDRFIEGSLPSRADTLDLIVLQGFPNEFVPDFVAQEVASLASNTSLMILSSPGMQTERLTNLLSNANPLRPSGQNTSSEPIQFSVRPEAVDHPIMELQEADLSRTPNLGGFFRDMEASGDSRILMNAMFRGSDTGLPILAVRELGNQRIAQLNAHHLFRLQQHTDSDTREFLRGLILNMADWASTEPDDRLLVIRPTSSSFEEGEPVTFQGTLVNESGQPETRGRVELSITDEDGESYSYTMQHRGNGRFSLETQSFPAGEYEWEADAYRGNDRIDEISGRFNVNETNLEFTDTVRRDDRLRLIASETGGAFFVFDDMAALRDSLQSAGLLDYREERFTSVMRFHRSLFWFMIVLVLFTTEWGIRKWHNMP